MTHSVHFYALSISQFAPPPPTLQYICVSFPSCISLSLYLSIYLTNFLFLYLSFPLPLPSTLFLHHLHVFLSPSPRISLFFFSSRCPRPGPRAVRRVEAREQLRAGAVAAGDTEERAVVGQGTQRGEMMQIGGDAWITGEQAVEGED